MRDTTEATKVFDAIRAALAQCDKTQDPLNALVVWTELGKALSGKLERQGGGRGLLRSIVTGYCDERGAPPSDVDLAQWMYKLPPDRRLGGDEMAAALVRVERAIGDSIAGEWGDTGGDERVRDHFLAVVRGWFPVGIELVRALPAARGKGDHEAYAALSAWCKRYLPSETDGPQSLGVRVEPRKQHTA